MPRPTRVQEIVAAATKLFNERGFQGTSVRAIAEGAGMHSGGLYSHFPSKEALLHHIVSEANQHTQVAVEAIRDGSLDPEAKFRAALLAHVRANIEVEAAAMSRILLTEWRHLTGREFDEVLGQRRAYEQLWDDIIVEAIEAGVFRKDVDPHMVRLITLSVGNWAGMWFNPKGEQTVDEVFGRAADEMLRGFLAR
ncbi:DNA-binding transcriptional regulator, AcrR family [Actinomadura madurae]|uniref:DNA-binding transcriptional regulator, AcrR family n=1 Tax=Actinomadura madurae TaxID=1993 RepID=A0A1I5MAA4_9ACTN|nr:TetR/AcrR family transcriptional regulator [Actinomadura madurae]SFP06403.1 DNA-binding transcriptional regulator, AcrR family [Actinomadura madurae]